MGEVEGTDLEAVLPTYDKLKRPSVPTIAEVGQIVRTVVPELSSKWQVFDAARADQSAHNRVEGTIRSVDCSPKGCGDYLSKPARLPIFKLRLGECEELLAVRSKLRPCVVLATAQGIPDTAIPNQAERNRAREAVRHPAYLVAPAYSVSTASQPRSFGPTIASRAQCLVYPQFIFLPTSGGIIKNESIVRLDRAFWTTLAAPTEFELLFLSTERLKIAFGQLVTLQGKNAGDEYIAMVEMIRTLLPPEHEAGL